MFFFLGVGVGCGQRIEQPTVRPTRPDVETVDQSPATNASRDNKLKKTTTANAGNPAATEAISLAEADWKQLQTLIGEQTGKIVVVDVWSTSCEPCMTEFPHLIQLQKKYPDDLVCISFDVDFVGIKNKPPAFYRERVLKFLSTQEQSTVLHRLSTTPADELFSEINLDSIPAVYVYGRDGKLAKRFHGASGDGEGISYEKQVVPMVDELVKPVSSPTNSASTQNSPTKFEAKDSLAVGEESSPDARECLKGLAWTPVSFEVTLQSGLMPLDPAIVRFPSPQPVGNAMNDLVAMEWYSAKNDADEIIDAPAIIVVHESGAKMEVGRLIAKALHAQGLHAFLIHLPTYGLRRPADFVPQMELISTVLKQGITDARRARDAVAVLPHVDSRSVSIQGTSLGGFVTATAAGIDRGFTTAHIMVSGGNLYEVINNGTREAGKMREMLAQAGYTGEKLRDLVAPIEPLRLAHRYDKKNTWLYTASKDQVIPPERAKELRLAAGLDEDHEMIFLADHYSGIIYVPVIVTEIAKRIKNELADRQSTR